MSRDRVRTLLAAALIVPGRQEQCRRFVDFRWIFE